MSKAKIKPVGDRILIQYAAEEEQVRGGIIIPDAAREKPQQAKVIALGTGTRAKDGTPIAFAVKVGDTVLLGGFAGSEVKLDDQKYTLVRADEILALLT